MFAWSRDWTSLLPFSKNLSAFHFHLCRLLKQHSCTLLNFELTDENVIKELGAYNDGNVRVHSFRPVESINSQPQNKHFGVQKSCIKLCGTVDV